MTTTRGGEPIITLAAKTVPTTTARTLPYVHDMLPPGIARQIQAEHDVRVAALETLLAESRQDADRNAEYCNRNASTIETLSAELVAARRVVMVAKDLVDLWDACGYSEYLAREIGPAGHLVRTVQGAR